MSTHPQIPSFDSISHRTLQRGGALRNLLFHACNINNHFRMNKGNSEKGFLEYIKTFDLYNLPTILVSEKIIDLEKLGANINWLGHSNSLTKGESSWIEISKN